MSIVDLPAELAAVDFGDKRLNARARLIVGRLQQRPASSFPALFDESELESHYRFTNNEAVELHKLLSHHTRASWGRSAAAPHALVVHDTTELSFPGESEREGLAFMGTRSVLQLHVSLLVGTVEAPVVHGLAGMRGYLVAGQLWGEVMPGGDTQALTSGSDRWRDAAISARADAPSGTRLVHVMDREADDFALWRSIIEQGDDFVIRSAYGNRLTTAPTRYLAARLQDEPFLFGRKVYLSRRAGKRPSTDVKRHPTRDARFARLVVRAGPVEVLRPSDTWRKGLPKTLALHVVEIVEAEPPEGEEPISWRLITTLPVSTADEVERVVDIYRKRWLIEEYFKALKTGCSLEDRQAETRWALLNTLGLLAPVAVRLLQLRALGRHEPDVAASGPLDELELTVLRYATGQKLPKRPSNKAVMMALARLGGHLRSNGDPGWLVLARGYARLLRLAEGWRAALVHLRKPTV